MNAADTRHPFLTFRLADQHYALPVARVVEVAAMVELTAIPDAPPELLGIANRHGEPLLVVDLRHAFNMPAAPITAATLFIVTHYQGKPVGLVVDEVYQVIYVRPERLQTTQGTGQYVRQIISDETELIQVLSLEGLLARYDDALQDNPQQERNESEVQL